MTYGLLGLWPTHDLPSLGLSTPASDKPHNTTSRTEIQAMTGRGRCDAGMIMMASGIFATHVAHHKEPCQGHLDDRGVYGQT
jgi:hypothetical protein